MKTPLHYQMTEYDCGPISMMNAIIFLFDREQIPPDLIRNIMLYCLDGYGAEGAPGRSGTTRAAIFSAASAGPGSSIFPRGICPAAACA